MLRKPFQALRTPSPRLDSRAPEPESNPNTHLEDPNLSVESLRGSSDDGRENDGDGDGDGDGFGTLPEGRMLIVTCVSDDGVCCMYVDDQESRRQEEILRITYLGQDRIIWESCPLDTIELLLKQNPEVLLNKREVYPGHEFGAALIDLMQYGEKVPRSEQVANKFKGYLAPRPYSIDEIIILGEELPPSKRIEELELTDAAFGIQGYHEYVSPFLVGKIPKLPKLRKQRKQHVSAEDLLEGSSKIPAVSTVAAKMLS